jgi:hypothetical protein
MLRILAEAQVTRTGLLKTSARDYIYVLALKNTAELHSQFRCLHRSSPFPLQIACTFSIQMKSGFRRMLQSGLASFQSFSSA